MGLSEIIKAAILGIIEGITEWLPISSTGHMILADEFIQLNMSRDFKEMFLVVIQLGAIMAVVLLYFNKLNPFSSKKTTEARKSTANIWLKVLIGVIPAGVLGILLDDWLDEHFYNYITVAIMLLLYGILFIIIENYNKDKIAKITSFSQLPNRTAFGIGLFQLLSLIPGTSRSGATILGAMILGSSRSVAAEFSFFMSIPIMFGASAIKLINFGLDFSSMEIIVLLAGMLVAFLVSVISIRFLMRYIRNHDFKAFGWYRIILGLVILAYFLLVK